MGDSAGMHTAADFEQMLREADLRVTSPRLAVLEAVFAIPHADTDAIITAVRDGHGDVSHQAVYDVLKALTSAGLVRRIQPAGAACGRQGWQAAWRRVR